MEQPMRSGRRKLKIHSWLKQFCVESFRPKQPGLHFASCIIPSLKMFAGMMGRRAAPVMAQRMQGLQGAPQEVQARSVATLKTLSLRMRSIKNMQKITKAMKMVATAKFKKDQARMEGGLPFATPVMNLFQRLPTEEKSGPITYVAVTSDKGLCGGVNSQVAKQVRSGIAEEEAKGNACKIMVIGGKGVSGMKRLYGDRFSSSFEEVSKMPFNFATASIMAERLAASKPTRAKIVSNNFKSMVAYDTVAAHTLTVDEAHTMDKSEWTKAMDVYSFEPSIYEVWEDLHEFYYGCSIYAAFLQSATVETAQRMSAMENASKNAGEMYGKVELQFNRARQAKITTELCEIISGASAV
eukprot:TRINITY_DN4971_c0_g1_i7.p1 TRINITY_DN4971_c0_g1~~TRINITY_DN4971_c0_g1_i7.p1  ORF type:complete len:354 (+),score=74.59 TRINITY_DN4971_c0_g1_i7:10-1071(+)